MPRIFLSPPHLSGLEQQYVDDAFASNWIAPLGPNVDAFEAEFCAATGAPYALATSSGTAALHLALLLAGVGAGDEVLVSTLTFAATANPVVYLGGHPTFLDSERASWNMDPDLLAEDAGPPRPPPPAAQGRGARPPLRPVRRSSTPSSPPAATTACP